MNASTQSAQILSATGNSQALEELQQYWMELPVVKRRITTVEIYMLCPQLGTINHGSDVERFISWFSESQMSSQHAGRMEYKYRPANAGMELDSISTAKCNDAVRRGTG